MERINQGKYYVTIQGERIELGDMIRNEGGIIFNLEFGFQTRP